MLLTTEMGGRYFPTLTTSLLFLIICLFICYLSFDTINNGDGWPLFSHINNVVAEQQQKPHAGVAALLTESHCANTAQGRMKCQSWNANGCLTLYQDAKWSRQLCVCVVYHTVCHHIIVTTQLLGPHLYMGDAKWSCLLWKCVLHGSALYTV